MREDSDNLKNWTKNRNLRIRNENLKVKAKNRAPGIIEEAKSRAKRKARETECGKCGRAFCDAGSDCWDHAMLDCDLCHEGEHEPGFREESRDRLFSKLKEYQESESEPWKASEVAQGIIRWTYEFDEGNAEGVWSLLQLQKKSDLKRPDSIKKNELLGKCNSKQIRWLRENSAADSELVRSLLEENYDLATESLDYQTQAMSLTQLIDWITEYDSGSIDECVVLWDKVLEADKEKYRNHQENASISIKKTYTKMIRWYSEFKPTEEEKIYKIFQVYWNFIKDDDDNSKSVALRIASNAPSEKRWDGRLWPFIYRRAIEIVKKTEDMILIFQLATTLNNIDSDLPSMTLSKHEETGILNLFLSRYMGYSFMGDSNEVEEEVNSELNGSCVRIVKLREFTNVSVISIKGGVPSPEIISADEESLVLDFPNIIRRVCNHFEEDPERVLSEVVRCLERQRYQLENCWFYITPGLVSDYPELITSMLEDSEINLLFGTFDRGVSEDWSFLSFALLNGFSVVSNDLFRSEITEFGEIEEFLGKSKFIHQWDPQSESLGIGVGRLYQDVGDKTNILVNKVAKIVIGHYGEDCHHIRNGGILVSEGKGHMLVTILANSRGAVGVLVGHGAERSDGLRDKLLKWALQTNPDAIKVSIKKNIE